MQSTPQGTQASRGGHVQEVAPLTFGSKTKDVGPARRHFDRTRRIRRRADFVRVQTLGKRVLTRHFVLLVAASTEAGKARLGLVASKRVGGAVARNRIKRLCRECFRLLPGLLPDEIDLVVIAREGSDSMKLQEVRLEWEGAAPALRRQATEALARRGREPHVSAAGRPKGAGPPR